MTTFDATLGATVIQAPLNALSTGDNVIIAGLSGQRIKVLQFFLVIAAATNLVFKSGSTLLSGTMTYTANAAEVQDFIQLPITCNVGDSFIINNSMGVVVGGMIWYIQS